jgi:hypothetical protein
MSAIEQRQQFILEQLDQRGSVNVIELANHFDVNDMTFRRDLSELEGMELMGRIHGETVITQGRSYEPFLSLPNTCYQAEKRSNLELIIIDRLLHDVMAIDSNAGLTEVNFVIVFNTRPDGLCVSGMIAGAETDNRVLQVVKEAVPETPVFVNTGVNLGNIQAKLGYADGAITGTAFKWDGNIWNEMDIQRVKEFVDAVKAFRKVRPSNN